MLPGLFLSAWGQIVENDLYLNHEIRFERLAVEQGLSNNSVLTILQDHRGFMWFGTQDGLNKYDGYNFTLYQYNPRNSNSLNTDDIVSLCEDKTGLLWVGTGGGGGVNTFDQQKGKWTHYKHDPQNPNSIGKGSVHAILEDRFGFLWFATQGGGLACYDRKTNRFTRYDNNPENPHHLSSNFVWALHEDRKGRLWAGTSGGGLNRLDRQRNQFIRYRADPADSTTLNSDFVHSIWEDQQGLLWLCSEDVGLLAFNPDTGKCQARYRANPQNLNGLINDLVLAATQDAEGNFWIVSQQGLYQFNPRSGQFIRYGHESYLPHGGTDAHCIVTDRAGSIWVGIHDRGVVHFFPKPRPFRHYLYEAHSPLGLGSNQIQSVFEGADTQLYVATSRNLLRFDSANEQFSKLYERPIDGFSAYADDVITSVCEERPGIFWIATNGQGIICFDTHTHRETYYRHDSLNLESLTSNRVLKLFKDRTETIWVGSGAGKLQRYDRTRKAFITCRYPLDPQVNTELASIRFFYEDRQGNLWMALEGEWFGTGGGGLYRFNRKTEQFTHYSYQEGKSNSLSSNAVTSLYQDTQDVFWIGTYGGGLNRLDLKTGIIKLYTKDEGLQSNTIHGVSGDQAGNLWLLTNLGINRFNPVTNQSDWYDYSDGLALSPIGGAVYQRIGSATFRSRAGTLYFGNNNGLTVFSPDQIQQNIFPPPIVITNFKVFDKVTPFTGDRIQLTYQQNFFEFEFVALNYLSSAKNQYAYQLEGVDKGWIYSGTRRRASYTDIRPGDYTFRVKGSNNDGVWNENGVTLHILIHPPWWRTGWFFTLASVATLGLLYGGFRYRIAQVRKEEAAKTELNKQQEQQKTAFNKKVSELEMQALRAQMNPHFIFNCLNSINRFILKNQSEAASDYLSKFSRLIRLILQNSNSPTVTLENELEALQLYLEMEALRFEGKFTFQIHCGEEVEADYIEIPPLIIQPYVENAIWHGLMHKQGTGHLAIVVRQENQVLVCSIEDNGIGRQRAGELRSKSAIKSKSLGMQITAHRLELIGKLFGKRSMVDILDLVATNGEPAGTRVLLRIPV